MTRRTASTPGSRTASSFLSTACRTRTRCRARRSRTRSGCCWRSPSDRDAAGGPGADRSRHFDARGLRGERSPAARPFRRPRCRRFGRRPGGRGPAVNHFQRQKGELHCEGVPLSELAAAVGTPAYVYSKATLVRHARVFRSALRGLDVQACFAVKSAPNLAILALLAGEGYGFDIVSGGELFRALQAGGDPRRIVFSGVGKRQEELAAALDAGIFQFNCESEEELQQLSQVAARRKLVAPVAIRVNPDVDARTHPHVATALSSSKFGVPSARARRAYRLAASLPGIRVVGVACHIGSQIASVRPFVEAATKMRGLVQQLRSDGRDILRLDMGGGLGVPYGDGPQPASPRQYGEALVRALRGLDVKVLVEPGRLLVANAGVLLSRVLLRKLGQGARRFVVIDAGMNDLLRPALYQ